MRVVLAFWVTLLALPFLPTIRRTFLARHQFADRKRGRRRFRVGLSVGEQSNVAHGVGRREVRWKRYLD